MQCLKLWPILMQVINLNSCIKIKISFVFDANEIFIFIISYYYFLLRIFMLINSTAKENAMAKYKYPFGTAPTC